MLLNNNYILALAIVMNYIYYTNQKPYAENRDDRLIEISAEMSKEEAEDVEDKLKESPEYSESKAYGLVVNVTGKSKKELKTQKNTKTMKQKKNKPKKQKKPDKSLNIDDKSIRR